MCTDKVNEFKVGQRVELHPATDRWMMGDRFGEVRAVASSWEAGKYLARVKLDKSGKGFWFKFSDVMHLSQPGFSCPCRSR
jgi:hypothetical protein